MDLTDEERQLLLSGLYELSASRAEDESVLRRIDDLVAKLGRDPDAMFFMLEHE